MDFDLSSVRNDNRGNPIYELSGAKNYQLIISVHTREGQVAMQNSVFYEVRQVQITPTGRKRHGNDPSLVYQI